MREFVRMIGRMGDGGPRQMSAARKRKTRCHTSPGTTSTSDISGEGQVLRWWA